MSESDLSSESSNSDKSLKMTKLKNKEHVNKSKKKYKDTDESSSSESSDEDGRQVSSMKKNRSKLQNHSDSDSSHIEPSQFRSPKDSRITQKLSDKAKSPKSKKKSSISASKSHDISSNSEDDDEVESSKKNTPPKKRKHEETSDNSSSDPDVSSKKKSTKSPQKMSKMQNGKSKSPGKGKSSHQLSKSTVLSSGSDDDDVETSQSKSPKKSKSSQSNKDSRDETGSELLDIHALAQSDSDDYELWLIKVPAKVPLSSLPKQVMMNGIQDFSNNKKKYEMISFTDDMVQRDHVSFIQGGSHQLVEGPCVKGQMQIVSKPSDPLRPVTAPLITHKPVPFPSGLKVRFMPFGADAPVLVNKSHKSKKHKKKRVSENEDTTLDSVEDVSASPRKKKKKKKHSIE